MHLDTRGRWKSGTLRYRDSTTSLLMLSLCQPECAHFPAREPINDDSFRTGTRKKTRSTQRNDHGRLYRSFDTRSAARPTHSPIVLFREEVYKATVLLAATHTLILPSGRERFTGLPQAKISRSKNRSAPSAFSSSRN
jgi:hypothetical protein